jgi:hypothetical protein
VDADVYVKAVVTAPFFKAVDTAWKNDRRRFGPEPDVAHMHD